jgi:hypothetical protein
VPTLVTTPGATDANSYATRDFATSWNSLALQDSAIWTGATSDQQDASLILATAFLDNALIWSGAVAGLGQALGWPRVGMFNRNGVPIASDIIPETLQRATAELAKLTIAENLNEIDAVAKANITSIKAGSVALTFRDTNVANASTRSMIDANVALTGPDFAWMTIPASVRLLLVPSWYLRKLLSSKVEFKVY